MHRLGAVTTRNEKNVDVLSASNVPASFENGSQILAYQILVIDRIIIMRLLKPRTVVPWRIFLHP
jgi:hypothetical protein